MARLGNLLFSSLLFSSLMFWLVRDAHSQNPDSHYVNKARNPDWNPELGEFAKNVGGQIPFVNTDAGVKPIFFDYAALDAYLAAPGIQLDAQHWLDAAGRWQGTSCAWYLGMQPGASCSNVCSTSNSLGSYNWERWTINGAAVTIKWDPTANPGVRHVFFSGPGGHSNAWRDWSTSTQPEPDCILQDPIFARPDQGLPRQAHRFPGSGDPEGTHPGWPFAHPGPQRVVDAAAHERHPLVLEE